MTKTDFDTCECGDYRWDHVALEGACKMCAQSQAPWDNCRVFRLHRIAHEIPAGWRLSVVPDA